MAISTAPKVNFIPKGYHTVTPYFVAKDARKLIQFATTAFDAKVITEMKMPDGSLMHAELEIGDSRIMLGQENPQHKAMPCAIYLYLPDTDAAYRKAVAAGARSAMEPKDQFYGDRTAGVIDENGNYWYIGTHIEDVPPEELRRRAQQSRQ